MILRALFWVAIVAVFMPHEPDLGLGRPDAIASAILPSQVAQMAGDAVAAPHSVCTAHAEGCAAALGILDRFQDLAVSSLNQVKAEIEQSQRVRAQRLAAN